MDRKNKLEVTSTEKGWAGRGAIQEWEAQTAG